MKKGIMQKIRLQVFVSLTTAGMLQEIANEHRTSIGGAIEGLCDLYTRTKTAQIQKSKVPPVPPSYQEVRNEQVIHNIPTDLKNDWAWLRESKIDESKNKVVLKRKDGTIVKD
jgi:hypothetical protein